MSTSNKWHPGGGDFYQNEVSLNGQADQSYASSCAGLEVKFRSRPLSSCWVSGSINLNPSASRYATIPRKRTSKLVPGFNQSYYESFYCDENASVASLPVQTKLTPSYLFGGREVRSSSIAHLYSLPPSSLPSVVEDDQLSFIRDREQDMLDQYNYGGCPCDAVETCYFLPKMKKDTALEVWKEIESKGKYDELVNNVDFAKPRCMRKVGSKAKFTGSDNISMWL